MPSLASKSSRSFKLNEFPSTEMDMNIEYLKQTFYQARDYEIINNSFNVKDAITMLEKWGLPKASAVKLKTRFGIEVDPNEIDDKTLVDLL